MARRAQLLPGGGTLADRLGRALAASDGPVAIEQDVLWSVDGATSEGRILVAHGGPLRGDEPTLDGHFFAAMTPRLESLLREGRRDSWPRYVLHLDFKSNEPALHAAVWALLGRYQRYLTTAARVADASVVQPLDPRPLLVLTEQGPGQEAAFHDRLLPGERLRLFGTVPAVDLGGQSPVERARSAVEASPDVLMPRGATNYRRWVNFPWAVVEEGGPPAAGSWTHADDARLRSIATRAHELGLWLRFYTLNGHRTGEGLGWTAAYNFGSLAAVGERWRAAAAAGVEFVASDQYEDVGRELGGRPRHRP